MNRFSNFVLTTLNPSMYHGLFKNPPFFEGWYFKLVDSDETQRYAIIPGVFLGKNGHAFIQVLNGSTAKSTYHKFDLADFWASEEKFEIRIGENYFSNSTIDLKIDDHLGQVSGKLTFEGNTPWPVSIFSPGIMGWYAWVPRMECYHGVLSFDHAIQGELLIDFTKVDFTGGHGYIEKDWGQSFPAGYVWFQSNHFAESDTSLTASIAVIPWLNSAFRGFIVGLWHDGTLYRFATYTGAQIKKLSITDTQVDWVIQDRNYILEMKTSRAEGGLLHEPTPTEMLARVEETMLAFIEVHLSKRSGETIFAGIGKNAALEVNGDIPRLLAMKAK